MKPRWRAFARPCRCSTQIPVRVATSVSIKIFWLDLTLIIPLPSIIHLILIRNAFLKSQNHSSSFVLNTIRRTTSRTSRTCLLAPAPVDVRQHKVSQGKTALPQESLSSTSLCLFEAVQTKKGNTQEEMTCGWTPIHVQSFADNSLCFGVFPLSAKQQTKGELCPGVVPSAQINRL